MSSSPDSLEKGIKIIKRSSKTKVIPKNKSTTPTTTTTTATNTTTTTTTTTSTEKVSIFLKIFLRFY